MIPKRGDHLFKFFGIDLHPKTDEPFAFLVEVEVVGVTSRNITAIRLARRKGLIERTGIKYVIPAAQVGLTWFPTREQALLRQLTALKNELANLPGKRKRLNADVATVRAALAETMTGRSILRGKK